MRNAKYTDRIQVFETVFDHIDEMISCAVNGQPKNGVYVGEDSERYPCFDFEDYATETRFYWNFVFATSESELKEKLVKLKSMSPLAIDYNKFTEELAPMAYWGGDTNRDVLLTDDIRTMNKFNTLRKIGFTLHLFAWNPDKHWGS